jgi:sugar lactone lactonase YvrE
MTRVLGSGDVEVAIDVAAGTGEGPVWDVDRGELLWVDIPRGLVHRSRPDGGHVSSIDVGQPVGAVALYPDGDLLMAARDGLCTLNADTGAVELRRAVERDVANNRMNDGKCDSQGRFWVGTMDSDMREGAGSLYRVDAGLEVTKVLADVSVANGLGWSLDDRTMYFIDSLAHGVDSFAYDPGSGRISDRRQLIDVPSAEGLPDGMTIDAAGCLWVAVWGDSSVRRYTPDGRLDTAIELPATQITSCAFGGVDLDELFITSATTGLSEAERREQPHAGAVFRVRPGVEGLAPQRCAV